MVSDSVKSAQMNSAAKEIAQYQFTIQDILRNTPIMSLTPYDVRRITNLVNMMESKLSFIEYKMNTLDSFHLPLTFIIMPNGQQLNVAEYVRLHKNLVQHYRNML